jgi:two-component system response regulator PilR (NtrC family)
MSENERKITILVVDDESSILDFLSIMLNREGYAVTCAQSAAEALRLFKVERFDLLITDISMPDMNGIELMEKIQQIRVGMPVIVMTAHGSTESAVEAMKMGAADYLTKPFKIDEMKIAVESALKTANLEKENRLLRSELGKTFSFENIVGNSGAMQPVFDMIKRVAQTKTNILILGESGTGKELVAHAIHRGGGNESAPFVVVNCAAVPESLFESELFGHKKGSFTGAIHDKEGLFELAHGGTLFLDEVGEIPLAMQVKLLRAIQQKSFRPVGGTKDVVVDVRIICATNRDLEEMVKKGEYREDLFYRLNVIQIRLPSLRERKEDIPMLAQYFLRKFALIAGKSIKSISGEALEILMNYSFPGNVRELENLIERAVALENQAMIFPESLPQKIALSSAIAPETPGGTNQFDLEKGVENYERIHILRALEETKGVKKKAAKLLGISFRSLRYRIEKYGIKDPNPEESE